MLGVGDFPERNKRAQAIITSVAVQHIGVDVVLGAGGTVAGFFIPGAGLAATAGAMAVQFPLYRKLARSLSEVYETPQDVITRRMVRGVMLIDSAYTVTADAAVPLASAFLLEQFDGDFFIEIVLETLGELGLGFALSFLPIVGGIVAAAIDARIAATMTWRVGLMVAAYYQNGGKWVGGNRKATYDAVKDMTGGVSAEPADRADLNAIVDNVQEVFETQVLATVEYIIGSVLDLIPGASRDEVLKHLLKKGVPPKVAKEAVKRVMGV